MHAHTKPRTLDRFVAFESLDGAGTSTQLRLLDATLKELGLAHWITAEPTALATGTLIRQALRGDFQAESGTIARLFAADRYQHLHGAGQILEHLAAGELVLSDRYLFSSLAYQGEACGDDSPWQLNKDFPLPALVLYFEIDPNVALARIASRPEHDIYETLEFQRRLSAAYERAFDAWPEGSFALVRIDASLPQAEVGRAVQAALASHGLMNR